MAQPVHPETLQAAGEMFPIAEQILSPRRNLPVCVHRYPPTARWCISRVGRSMQNGVSALVRSSR